MNILGINSYLHDSSAALYQDGKLVFAAEEERFSRIKKDVSFPRLAIQAALDHGGILPKDLDAVAFGWNRGGITQLHTLRSMLSGRLPVSAKMSADVFMAAAREMYRANGKQQLRRLCQVPPSTPVFHIDHHLAHAWSAYAPSGFDEALVIVADGRGATQATTLYHARDGTLKLVKAMAWPNSLGAFYEAFTDLLGFERHNDEWKVMGLAAYGEPDRDLSAFLRTTSDGYRLNARLVCGSWWNDISQLERILGPRRQPEVLITHEDRNLAASVQKATEEAMYALVREGVRLTGCRTLCLAGGVAMNSKANGRLLASGLVDELFVQPAATDDGTAVGAALAAHQRLGRSVPRSRLTDVYLGPEFSHEDMAAAVRTYKLHGMKLANLEEQVASVLRVGAIVGWFQGRMEFGPRALGSRSILADPTSAKMKDRVNRSVKFRENWRPFAPSVLAESAGDYFEGASDAAFMTITFDVRPSKRDRIPAVTHTDNTARVQTVSRDSNPRYWRLIKEFERQAGVPVLLNTSFNLRGEPIVCTPKDAIRTFYSSGLDFLVLGDYLIAKDPTWAPNGALVREPALA
jgi:carbamoyltransferase